MLRQKANTLSWISRLYRSDSFDVHQLTMPRVMLKTEAKPCSERNSITFRCDSGGRVPRFVDLDLGSSPRWWAATVATYCPSRVVEHPKSKSTQPRYSTTRVTLYFLLSIVLFSLTALSADFFSSKSSS